MFLTLLVLAWGCANPGAQALDSPDVEPWVAPPGLELPPTLAERVAVHRASSLSAGGDLELVCALLAEALPLSADLGLHLLDVRDAHFGDPAFARFLEDVDQLDQALPTIGLASGAATFYAWPDFGDLAGRMPPGAASRSVIEAAGKLLGDPHRVWIVQTWDLGGCASPGAAHASLAALGSAWSSAEPCLQEALREPLRKAIEQLGAARCFCDDRATVEAEVTGLMALPDLPAELAPEPALKSLGAALHDPGSRYEDVCGG